jgi:magnesium transporter
VRIQDMLENIRDVISSAMDIYLNSISLRLNETMKALTVVSTISLPLSFVTGMYGMNFRYFPEVTWQYGYLLFWLLVISIAGGMLIFFKKRGWF